MSAELAGKLLNPLVFQWDIGVAEIPPATVKGYEASLLIDLCNAIAAAAAAGKLGRRYARIIAQAANSTENGTSTKNGTVPVFPPNSTEIPIKQYRFSHVTPPKTGG